MSTDPDSTPSYKSRSALQDTGTSAMQRYRELVYGDASWGRVILSELILLVFGSCPGALGLWLRSRTYRLLFDEIGKKVVFGRNLTLRHASKIRIGDRVIIDDGCLVDAKGTGNQGIEIGDDVYIGRNSIVYCKNGDITIGDRVNISSNCQVFSSNRLTIGEDTVIGAFTYLLSGGEYDIDDRDMPFAAQDGMCTRGPLVIGRNCWLAARVTVLDAAGIGDHCVIGAGAVVTKPVPPDSVAVGVPAHVVKSIGG